MRRCVNWRRRGRVRISLVSNLPYNAASPLIAELLVEMWKHRVLGKQEADAFRLSRLAFTVQYEVALRMIATPEELPRPSGRTMAR